MKPTTQKKLILITIIGLLWWLFGNWYEAIVISPNWVVDSPTQMKRLHEFFVNTTPTVYFVPVTILANVMVWVVYFLNRTDIVRSDLKRASIAALVASAINAFIVSTIITKLFAPDFARFGDELSVLTQRWNILNIFRMITVAITIVFLFRAFRKLDRLQH